MKIAVPLLLLSFCAWGKPKAQDPAMYWQDYETSANEILSTDKYSDDVKSKQEALAKKYQKFSELEYKEGEADKLNDKVNAHVKALQDKIYKTGVFLTLDYITWQRDAELQSAAKDNKLIITSHGVCAGGGYSYRNASYNFFADGCFVYGSANAAQSVNNITYRQSSIPTYGVKASIGAGLVSSTQGAEIGLKFSPMWSKVSPDNPNQSQFPGYKVDEGKDFMPLMSLYGSWPVKKAFIRTEFAYDPTTDKTLWGLGLGYNL